ncbi:MAG: ankyrin repeat domain-containing protein [Rhodoferax sp.]|nr:ankyrin repeat domain-containing protein [Rhodoferax sp.]
MLQAGADPNKPCKQGFDGVTPLVMTIGLSRSVEVASLLIDAGANVNDEWSEDATPIFETTSDQFYDLAKLLIDRGAKVNVRMSNGLTPLMYAARNGASRCVDLFLDAGADINAVEEEHGVGAFGLALNRLDLQLAEHLLARGAEPNFGSIETLRLAIAEHGTLAFVEALASRGCKLVRDDQRGRMAFVSARNVDPEVFDYLLNQGADPSQGNDFGYTPLILAALNNHHHLIRRYLTRGDDASVQDVDGETALSLAIEKRHEESVAVLREFHVEEGDYSALEPEAAMLKAAEEGAIGSILNLREAGVPINCCDGEGNSVFMIAVRAGHQGVVRSLYHLGADINHLNRAGETALALAKTLDSSDIVNTLQEFGALDAMTGALGKLSAMFGGIPIYNAADTMFGRMSHPYKDKPPYDNETADEEDDPETSEEDQDHPDIDQSVEGRSDESGVGASTDSKLDLLSQVLDSDQVKEQVPAAMLEQLTQKLDYWRSLYEESELDDDELAELNRLLVLFGLGEKEEAEAVERTPLFEAVHVQDLAAVRKIIKGGGDVNEVDGEGNTPLFIAVLTRQAKLVEELLKLGADPNKSRPDGKGPLFAAVRVAEVKITQTLLKGGAEVDAPLSMDHNGIAVGGCTALYDAALLGHLPSCKVWASSGASLEAANDLGYTPLMAAIEGDHEDVIDFFLKSGANVNPEVIATMEVEGLGGAFPLYTATRKENLAVITKLLKRGVDVNRTAPNGWTPLKSAAQQGSLEIVKVLLEAGADPNIADDTNYTPLMNAVSGEHEDIVKILLKFKADPNIQSGEKPEDADWEPGRSALMDAAFSGNVAIARELLKGGANPNLVNSKGWTALHSAVISASTDMVALLLKSGANPNIFGNDEEKLSALDLALRRWASEDEDDREGGISDVLELMLKKGMPSDRDSLTETALDLVTEGHLVVVDLLKKQGFSVDPNYLKNGASQLFIAAAVGDDRLQAAELFLQIGADANYKSPAGLSVLSLATRSGGVGLARLLLKAGANVMDRNSANVLAYDLAVIYGHDELIDLLIEHMNQVVPAIDKQADDGTTALMRAAMVSDVKAIKELLAEGADPSRRDRQGESPLSYAVAHDLDDVVQVFRAAGVERLPRDEAIGSQSIVHAGSQGALGTILDLLDSGTPIDLTDDN